LILYDAKVKDHLLAIEKKYHSLIRTTIEEQLVFDPEVETRNRKPLARDVDFEADWELRFGPDNRFRVFYAVDSAARKVSNPTMKIASIADVKAKFSAYVKASGQSPVVVTRNGKAVAAIIPLTDDDDIERLMLGYSPRLRSILSAARQRVKAGLGVEHNAFWQGIETGSPTKTKRKTA
jgi:prevent-host-death family protein